MSITVLVTRGEFESDCLVSTRLKTPEGFYVNVVDDILLWDAIPSNAVYGFVLDYGSEELVSGTLMTYITFLGEDVQFTTASYDYRMSRAMEFVSIYRRRKQSMTADIASPLMKNMLPQLNRDFCYSAAFSRYAGNKQLAICNILDGINSILVARGYLNEEV